MPSIIYWILILGYVSGILFLFVLVFSDTSITAVIITASLHCVASYRGNRMSLLPATTPLVKGSYFSQRQGKCPALLHKHQQLSKYFSALGNSTENSRESNPPKGSESKGWVLCVCDWEVGGRGWSEELIHELPLNHVVLLSVCLHGDARLSLCPLCFRRGFYF